MQPAIEHGVVASPVGRGAVYRAAVVTTAIVAIWLRTAQGGMPPLDPTESEAAYQAWATATGTSAPWLSSSSLVIGIQALVFFLLGADDVLARLVPYFSAWVLALTPLLFRDRLGSGPAVAAAFVLSSSPLFSSSARYLGGESLVLAVGAVALWAGGRYAVTRHRAFLSMVAASIALASTSGPEFHTLWASLALAVSLNMLLQKSPAAEWAQVRSALKTAWDDGGRPALLLFAVIFVAAATVVFFRMDGLGAALTGNLNMWLQRVTDNVGAYPLWPAIFLSEPLVIAAGGVGLAWALSRLDDRAWRWLALWALSAIAVVFVMRGRTAGDVMVAMYPLALLGGRVLAGLGHAMFQVQRLRAQYASFAVLVVLLVVALLALVNPLDIEMPERFSDIGRIYMVGQSLLTGAIALLLLTFIIGAARNLGTRGVGISLAAIGLSVLALVSLRTSAEVRFGEATLWRASIGRGATSPDVRMLGRFLHQKGSADLGTRSQPRDVLIEESLQPDLVWYVRGAPGVRFRTRADGVSESPIEVERAEGGLGAGGYDPAERRFRLSMDAAPEFRGSSDAVGDVRWDRLLRWVIYRETTAIARTENVVVRGVRL